MDHPQAGQAAPRVLLRQVSKRFGSTAALQQVSLAGAAGSIHAVTGENGAGKSTLMKLLAGVHAPDEGEIFIDGVAVRLASPAAARRLGVSTVFQELTVLPNLSVAENLCLGREPLSARMLDRGAMRRQAEAVLARAGISLAPHRACRELSIGEQQMLEIAKGLAAEARIFIFDEPTAPLNRAEVDRLERLLLALKAQGKLIFYISHRLEEIFRFCDTVSVLKDGQHVCTQASAALNPDRLVSLMVGRELQQLFPPRAAERPGAALLHARGLQVGEARAGQDLTLRAGEIVGMAGLEGQGQRELLRALAGLARPRAGSIELIDELGRAHAVQHRHGAAQAVRQGVALMPEDRKAEGLYLDLPIQDNIWLGRLRGTRLWQRARRDPALITRLAERMQMRSAPALAVGALSGGNQQKVMLGRWLASGVRVLLVEQPTRGVDVGAKAEIYGLLRQFVAEGGTVLAVSGDLPELIGLCDRILVLRQGAIVGTMAGAAASEEGLLALALQERPAQAGIPSSQVQEA